MLEIRSVEFRSVDLETRTIAGLAVPYGQTVDVGDYKESFVRGVFDGSTDVKLFNEHREIIGLVTKGEDTEAGYAIEARISKTSAGNDTYELLKDGAVNKFSVGFIPVEQRDDNGVVVRTKATLKEVSVVAFPAYDGASISEVRAEENPNNEEDIIMSEENKEVLNRVANLEAANEELERRFAVAGETKEEEAPVQFRTAGDFVKAQYEDTAEAREEVKKIHTRAYTGSVLADSHTHQDWKTDLLRIVTQNRNIVNLFNKGPLPAQGMTVDAVKVSAVTGAVASQVAEGDDLTLIKIDVDPVSYAVRTYGAYSELSRQVIERSDVPFLNLTLNAQTQSYAKVTNDRARAVMVATTPVAGTSLTLSTAKGADWLNAILDGVDKIRVSAAGAQADFVLVSRDVYLKIATLADTTDRPLNSVNGDGVNTFGNVRNFGGTFCGLPLFYDGALAAKSMYIASSDAVTTWETPGVPFRLDTENPLNLTHVYSVYGYLAVGATNELAIVKPTIA